MSNSVSLPIVDVGCLFEQRDERPQTDETASALLSAFERFGMAYLKFDGSSLQILRENVDPAFAEAKLFFERPTPQKQSAVAGELPKGVTRGYLGTGAESGADQFEWKEAFSWSYNWEQNERSPQNSLEARNVWPETGSTSPDSNADEMKGCFDTLFGFMCTVMLTLVDAVSEVWPEDYGPIPDLHELCKQGESISLLRSFHYYGTKDAKPGMTGSCQHTDWGFATLIAQRESGGNALQVFLDGKWHDVPPIADTLVVNCSDFLSMATNGRLRSPLHRVILTEKERLSFVFFQYPGFETPIPTLSEEGVLKTRGLSLLKDQSDQLLGKGSESTPQHLKDLSFGEFIAMKWQQVSRT